ncbi:hypothetical protein QF042_003305 [Pedobacter sp. W3I1]|uniref:hypothetical protein n=1 Tax=Pedobacter sp. W3I1 TaxID=3042291 RepID=UPI002787ECED|nr:hypothetical protein [Pedobacter sp. W3I1]MDQ0639740.1 hypothetical protein [Pedobacter sp. W3I1]
MKTKDSKNTAEKERKSKGSSKEKATFDQNGKGASDKFGQAGSTPNESGEGGPGTIDRNKKA